MSRILIIEDNLDIRENLEEILELSNYEVLSAENGQKGINCIWQERPDLILCDIAMPKMNGFQVLKTVKSKPLSAAIPFIFVTSSAQSRDIQAGIKAGADAYLTKPFSREQLVHLIKQFLGEQVSIN